MLARHHRVEQYELLPRTSEDSTSSNDTSPRIASPDTSKLARWSIRRFLHLPLKNTRSIYAKVYRQRGLRGRLLRASRWILVGLLSFIAILIVLTAAFQPSYSHPPDHYRALRRRCTESKEPGRGNINNERIFIAASLYDPEGRLVDGDWGKAVLRLIELLGPQNVHLSVYEDDASPKAKAALASIQGKVSGQCPLLCSTVE